MYFFCVTLLHHLQNIACLTASTPVGTDTATYKYFNINPATGAISMKSSISNFPEDDVMLTIAAKDEPPNQPTLWSNPIQVRYDTESKQVCNTFV